MIHRLSRRRPYALLIGSAIFMASLAACGSPQPGEKCTANGFMCADATAALECRSAAWVLLPCRGPMGCKRESDLIRCDMSANLENDACASTAESKGVCTPDGLATLECREGVFVKTNTCRSCAISGETVVCTR